MTYPLKMSNGIGYAVANTEAEYEALYEAGYDPEDAASQGDPDPITSPETPAPDDAAPTEPKRRGRPRKDAT